MAKSIGIARTANQKAVSALFSATFLAALKTVGKQFGLIALKVDRLNFCKYIIDVFSKDLNGYALEAVVIDDPKPAPVKMLDPDNIFATKKINQFPIIYLNNQ